MGSDELFGDQLEGVRGSEWGTIFPPKKIGSQASKREERKRVKELKRKG